VKRKKIAKATNTTKREVFSILCDMPSLVRFLKIAKSKLCETSALAFIYRVVTSLLAVTNFNQPIATQLYFKSNYNYVDNSRMSPCFQVSLCNVLANVHRNIKCRSCDKNDN
jgi:hypothetical protein